MMTPPGFILHTFDFLAALVIAGVAIPAAIDPSIAMIVAALIGSGVFAAITNFRKTGKEADSIAANTLINVNAELRLEIARRDAQIARLEERVSHLEGELNKQLTRNIGSDAQDKSDREAAVGHPWRT